MKLNYISNLRKNEVSGGWSGLNNQISNRLFKIYDLTYVGPFEIPTNFKERVTSRLLRLVKIPSRYYHYSENRLLKIAFQVNERINNNDACIFFGATPWVKYKPKNDYYIITDISFADYYKYYNKAQFKKTDIERIKEQEKLFMKNAKFVFFTSNWAKNETCKIYNLNGSNFINIGIAGNIEGTLHQKKTKDMSFIFISQDFKKKGGHELFLAFTKLYDTKKGSTLIIIGGLPPRNVIKHPGVKYIGFINKSLPEDTKKYIQLLGESSALILPTKNDAAPLSIIECGYFGTPTIAPNRFAIPELVIPNKTGYLLDNNFTIKDLYDAMVKISELPLNAENELRKSTYHYFHDHNTWGKIANKISSYIDI